MRRLGAVDSAITPTCSATPTWKGAIGVVLGGEGVGGDERLLVRAHHGDDALAADAVLRRGQRTRDFGARRHADAGRRHRARISRRSGTCSFATATAPIPRKRRQLLAECVDHVRGGKRPGARAPHRSAPEQPLRARTISAAIAPTRRSRPTPRAIRCRGCERISCRRSCASRNGRSSRRRSRETCKPALDAARARPNPDPADRRAVGLRRRLAGVARSVRRTLARRARGARWRGDAGRRQATWSDSPRRCAARCGTSSRSIRSASCSARTLDGRAAFISSPKDCRNSSANTRVFDTSLVGRRHHRTRGGHGDLRTHAGGGDSISEVRRPRRRAAEQLRHAAVAHGESVRRADRRAHAGRIRERRRRPVAQLERRGALRARVRLAGGDAVERRRRGRAAAQAMRGANPTIFFEHRSLLMTSDGSAHYPGDDYVVPFGRPRCCATGSDLTLVTWGALVHRCVEAAERFGDRVEVIDLRTIAPWDRARVLESVGKTGRCVIVHEDNITAGFGAEIAATVAKEAFWHLDAPVDRVAVEDVPMPYHPDAARRGAAERRPNRRANRGDARRLAATGPPHTLVQVTNPSGAARCGLRGSSSLAGFDHSVRRHERAWSDRLPFSGWYRSHPVLWNSDKATVTSSDLVTGEATSNLRLTMPRTASRRSITRTVKTVSDRVGLKCNCAFDPSIEKISRTE